MGIHNVIQPIDFEPLTVGRQVPRQRTLFVIGKLTVGEREHVCRVRNISQGGVGIEQEADIAVGDVVTIELRGLAPSRAVVRWIDAPRAGLEFVAPARLQHDASQADGHTLRSPRFATDTFATLRMEDAHVDVIVRDIALGGMKVAIGGLRVGSPVTIVLRGHETALSGCVCWTSLADSGIHFASPITTQALMAILRDGAGETPTV